MAAAAELGDNVRRDRTVNVLKSENPFTVGQWAILQEERNNTLSVRVRFPGSVRGTSQRHHQPPISGVLSSSPPRNDDAFPYRLTSTSRHGRFHRPPPPPLSGPKIANHRVHSQGSASCAWTWPIRSPHRGPQQVLQRIINRPRLPISIRAPAGRTPYARRTRSVGTTVVPTWPRVMRNRSRLKEHDKRQRVGGGARNRKRESVARTRCPSATDKKKTRTSGGTNDTPLPPANGVPIQTDCD